MSGRIAICFHCGKRLESEIAPVTCEDCRANGHSGMPYAGCLICAKTLPVEEPEPVLKESVESVLRDMLLLTVIVLGVGSVMGFAPVPRHKVPPRPELVGKTWVMRWGHGDYHARFWKDGHYECYHADSANSQDRTEWHGTWKLIEDRFIVTDSYTWEANLKPGKWEGSLTQQQMPFRLTALPNDR